MKTILAAVLLGVTSLLLAPAPSVESAPVMGVAVAEHHAAIVNGTAVAGGVS